MPVRTLHLTGNSQDRRPHRLFPLASPAKPWKPNHTQSSAILLTDLPAEAVVFNRRRNRGRWRPYKLAAHSVGVIGWHEIDGRFFPYYFTGTVWRPVRPRPVAAGTICPAVTGFCTD